MKEIRLLNKNEISAKVKTVLYGGRALILLYKDARVDMTLLDETFGPMNWKRSHKEVKGNLFCTISVWDEDKKQWIDKEDVGIESQSEGEKGEASDSFKRSGFNWGIGRELYTAPVITIKLDNDEYKDKKVYTRFYVSEIGYNGRDISLLEIVDGNGRKRFSWKSNLPMGNDEKDMEPLHRQQVPKEVEPDYIALGKKLSEKLGLVPEEKNILWDVAGKDLKEMYILLTMIEAEGNSDAGIIAYEQQRRTK